jgi:hypothetical protein
MVVADLYFNGVLYLYLYLYFKRAVVQLLLTRHVALTCCADTAQGGYDLVMQTFDFFGSQKELGEMGLASFRTFCNAVDVPLKSKGIDTLFMVPLASPVSQVYFVFVFVFVLFALERPRVTSSWWRATAVESRRSGRAWEKNRERECRTCANTIGVPRCCRVRILLPRGARVCDNCPVASELCGPRAGGYRK